MGTICIDSRFSTTRSLIKTRPASLKELPPNTSRFAKGGLRVKGYYKKSYPGRPLISVITVVRNDLQYLERAIQSVLNQPYDNVEYIIIDGASTDGTVDIVKKYQDYIDYWVSEADQGIFDAMNKGVKIACGKWVYFLGADDILINCLHKIAPYLKNKHHIYYGDVYLPTKNKTYDGKFNVYKLMIKNINQQAIFYPKRVFDKYEYNLKYSRDSDYELNIRAWADKNFRFVYIPFLIAVYNDSRYTPQEWELIAEKQCRILNSDKPKLIKTYFSKALLLQKIYASARNTSGALLRRLGLKEILLKFFGGD